MTYIGVSRRQHAWHSFTWNHGRFPENSPLLSYAISSSPLPSSLSSFQLSSPFGAHTRFELPVTVLCYVFMCIFAYLSRNSIVVSALGCSRLVRSMHDPQNVEPEDDVFTRRTRASLYARTREPCVVDSPDAALLEDFVVFSSCLLCSRDPRRMEKPSSPITVTIFHRFPAILPRSNISKSIRAIYENTTRYSSLWNPFSKPRIPNAAFLKRPLPWDETSNARLREIFTKQSYPRNEYVSNLMEEKRYANTLGLIAFFVLLTALSDINEGNLWHKGFLRDLKI